MQEIISKRTANTKIYDLGGGHRRWERFSGSVHYQETPDVPDDPWLDIDTTINPSSNPNWDWEVTKGHWSLLVKNDTTIALGKDGHWIGFQLTAIAYLDGATKNYEILQPRQPVAPTVQDNRIRWDGIFNGVNLEYVYDHDQFRDNIEITQVARDWCQAHPPSDYGLNNATSYLTFLFEFDWGNAYPATVSGNPVDWDQANEYEEESVIFTHPVKAHIVSMLVPCFAKHSDLAVQIDMGYLRLLRRFFKYQNKNWLLLGARVQDLNPFPIGTIIFDPTWTVQPSNIDARISQNNPNTNYGTQTYVFVASLTGMRWRSVIEFDLTGFPGASGDITLATLYLYYFAWVGNNPVGRSVHCYKCTRTDWTELGVTWNERYGGASWTAAGGDYTNATFGVGDTVPGPYGWMDWDITNTVVDAIDNVGGWCELLMRFSTENTGVQYGVAWYSKDEAVQTTLRPKIVIDYTPAGWTGKISGVTNPAKIMGVDVADITKVKGVA